MNTELAIIDPQSAGPGEMREWAIAVRAVIPRLGAGRLLDVEAVLVAIARRLRGIGQGASEAERSRVMAMTRYGELLGPPVTGRPEKANESVSFPAPPMSQEEMNRRSQARLLAEQQQAVAAALARPQPTLNQVVKAARLRRHEHENAAAATGTAVIECADWRDWLPGQDECDLLLTDPPYSTDLDDVYAFANAWLPEALKKVRPAGRAYVCVGAYPEELHAYLSVPSGEMTLAGVLAWTYRNTLGPSPALDYVLNWQAVLYYRGPAAGPLDCPKMTEQFAVQDIAAPDGRLGNRYHTWQKPDDLAERFIRHATAPGDTVLDPFAGTGTFLLAAARLGRHSRGCDVDGQMVSLAAERGCEHAA